VKGGQEKADRDRRRGVRSRVIFRSWDGEDAGEDWGRRVGSGPRIGSAYEQVL